METLGSVSGIDAVLADPFAGLDNALGTLTVNSIGQMLGQDSGGPLGSLDFTGSSGGAFDFRPVQPDGTYPGTNGFDPYMDTGGGGGGGGGTFAGGSGDTGGGQFGVVNDISGGGTYLLPDGSPAYQGDGVGIWGKTQMQNAQVIAKVGKKLGATPRDIQVAIMAAMTESSLQNLDHGDRDSVGLFQQRNAWGSFADRTDPAKAAEMFFQGGAAGQRGLFDIPGHEHMSLGAAAQAVQVSAYPDRYTNFQDDAQQVLGLLGRGGDSGPPGQARQSVVAQAKKYLGTPYVWGATGPTSFDCSGLVQYVYKQMGIDLPRVSYQQANVGPHIPLDQLKVGDLVGWDLNGRNAGADHIAIYVGNGNVIEAPRPGTSVQIAPIFSPSSAWGVDMSAFFPKPEGRPSRSSSTAPDPFAYRAPAPKYDPTHSSHPADATGGSIVSSYGGHTAAEPSSHTSGGTYHPPTPAHVAPSAPEHGSHTKHSAGHPGGHEADPDF